MPIVAPARVGGLVALIALYIILYRMSDLLAGNEVIGMAASILFLPAFVRLLGYLVFGFWAVPALFVAAMACVDLGLPSSDRLVVAMLLALGGPLGAHLVSRWCRLEPGLANLSPLRLLAISLGCASGNALFYETGLALVGVPNGGAVRAMYILLGDTLGTWAIIYLIKIGLTFGGRMLRT